DQRFQSVGELAQALAPFAHPVPGFAGPVRSNPMMPAAQPAAGAISHPVTGPRMPAAPPATVAIGAMTPPGMQQSVTGWPTNTSTLGIQPAKTPVAAVILVGVLALGGVFGGALWWMSRKATAPVIASSVVEPSAIPSAIVGNVPPPASSDSPAT